MLKTVNLIFRGILTGLLLAVFWGCSSSNSDAPTLNANGQHPAAWPTLHGVAYLDRAEQCYECHGRDLKGGISKVSCFSASWNGLGCHVDGPGGHPAGWANPTAHGPHAKAKVGGADGFPSCQKCHGTLFDGGSVRKSCYTCHGVNAPHSPKPWRGPTYTHTTTDPSNAAVCALCHTAGANLTPALNLTSYAAGTPGCFNSTLCHGAVGHPAGWNNPANHGASAKAAPSPTSGIAYCKNCHGADYAGGTVNTSCLNNASCHGTGVLSPHARKPWRGGTMTHTTTDPANAAACADCHTAGANLTPALRLATYAAGTPGCFNATLCHGAVGHAAGWNNPTAHGTSAKAAPGTTSGFDYCRNCHGASFNGGFARTCLNTAGCHGTGVQSPHSPTPWKSATRTHTTTDPGNAPMCDLCHHNGQNLISIPAPNPPAASGTSPGCFNNTLCHGLVPHPAGWTEPLAHGPQYGANPQSCTQCHGQALQSCLACHPNPVHNITTWEIAHGKNAKLPPGGTFDSFFTCQNCHGADFKGTPVSKGTTCLSTTCHKMTGYVTVPPHTGAWNDPYNFSGSTHTTTDQANAPVCYQCHHRVQVDHTWLDTTGKATVIIPNMLTPLTGNPDPNATPGCFNNTLCHGQFVGGHAFPNPGATHRAAAGVSPFTACTGCHVIGTAASPYPVAAGVKPDCMACHTKAAPVGSPTSGCYSCHGASGATDTNIGRPVGSAFPDRQGRHGLSDHNVACVTCHSGAGTGTATHGNSNRVKKTPQNVTVTFSGDAAGMNFTSTATTTAGGGTCTGTCHTQTHTGESW